MKRTLISAALLILAAILVSCSVVPPVGSNDPGIESGMSESALSQAGSESSAAEETPTEPPAWTHILLENYAVYQIIGKADETMQFSEWDGMTWQKYTCEIIYMFPEEDYWQKTQPGDVDETGLGFGEQHNDEIWIPETESAMISDGMYLLISPEKYHLNNKVYWMPDICDGKTEYLRFLDGKLSVPEGALDTGAFRYLKAVNAVGEDYWASSSEWVAILSRLRFSDGLSVEETTAYFEKVKEAYAAFQSRK